MTYMLFFTLLKRTTVHKVVYQRPHPHIEKLVFLSPFLYIIDKQT